jgi:hypothetical protein
MLLGTTTLDMEAMVGIKTRDKEKTAYHIQNQNSLRCSFNWGCPLAANQSHDFHGSSKLIAAH